MGTLDTIREAARQEATQDENFYKKIIYYFELQVPEEASQFDAAEVFLFPLALNPENYSMNEPFALEKTCTQGGGLYVEEDGIAGRTIQLRGSTGFKPRPLKGFGTQALKLKIENRSHGRRLLADVFSNLSGQRHFHYLQDVVFRTYSDLKRDPATSEGTNLIF